MSSKGEAPPKPGVLIIGCRRVVVLVVVSGQAVRFGYGVRRFPGFG